MAHVIDAELCSLCGVCESSCEQEAITMDDEKCTIDPEKCNDCGDCVLDCPTDAISKLEN